MRKHISQFYYNLIFYFFHIFNSLILEIKHILNIYIFIIFKDKIITLQSFKRESKNNINCLNNFYHLLFSLSFSQSLQPCVVNCSYTTQYLIVNTYKN